MPGDAEEGIEVEMLPLVLSLAFSSQSQPGATWNLWMGAWIAVRGGLETKLLALPTDLLSQLCALLG